MLQSVSRQALKLLSVRAVRQTVVRRAVAAMAAPAKITYVPLRGRAEVIRLALSFKGIPWDETAPDRDAMKKDFAQYPFGQMPAVDIDGLHLVQSNAILRHIGRAHGLYGSNESEMTAVDMLLDFVEDFRNKYVNLIYTDLLSDAAKIVYANKYLKRSGLEGPFRNGGVHLGFLDAWLTRRASGPGPFSVGSSLTIADLQIFDILDLHARIFADEVKAYPALVALHACVAAQPGIRDYLASSKRPDKINGNALG